MNRLLPVCLAIAAGLAATLSTRPAEAQIANLTYGMSYNFQNSYDSYVGGYLATAGSGCSGGDMCVASSLNPVGGGAAGWVIASAQGKAMGTNVVAGDIVYLHNLYSDAAGYLVTAGTGCNGDLMCVSTASATSASTEWKIQTATPGNPILISQPVSFLNGSSNFTGGYLDTDGTGCAGDYRCVGTSSNSSSSAIQWVASPSTDALGASGICITTDQPQTLMDNGQTSLVWDQYGDLALSNYAGAGRTTDNLVVPATSQVWGVGSAVPLTGSTAATLCFSTNGILSITNSSGIQVWSDTTTTSSDTRLHLDGCQLKMRGSDSKGNVQTEWMLQTEECALRSRPNAVPQAFYQSNLCWPAGSNTVALLSDDQTGLELDWVNGELNLINDNDGSTWWTSLDSRNVNGQHFPVYTAANAAQLCYQQSGNVVILDANSNVLWNTMSGLSGAPTVQWALDSGGFGFWNGITQYIRADAYFNYAAELSEFAQPSVTINTSTPQWCLGKDVNEVILSRPGQAYVAWSFHMLEAFSYANTFSDGNPGGIWETNVSADHICFLSTGDLVLYDANNNQVWDTNTVNLVNGTTPNALTLDGDDFALVDQTKANECNQYFANCVYQLTSQCLNWAQYDSVCQTTSYFALWTPNEQSGTTQYTAGGFSFIKDDKVGDSDFGAEAWVIGAAYDNNSLQALQTTISQNGNQFMANAVNADIPSSAPSDFMVTMGELGADVTLFGTTPSSPVFDANAYIQVANTTLNTGFTVSSLGTTIYSGIASWQGVTIALEKEIPTPFEASATFDVGIPVTVSGSVGESVGIDFTGGGSAPSFTVTATPNIALDAILKCGIGVKDASAGIEGSITLAELSVPFKSTLNDTASQPTFTESGTLEGSMLSGDVSLYAEAGPFSATKELASWDGITSSIPLFSVNGNL